jgi:hypothetical protein
MIVQNKTKHFKKCGGKSCRPWRQIEVPEGTQVDDRFFEIVGKKVESKPKSKKEKVI